MSSFRRIALALLLLTAGAAPLRAVDNVTIGTVGSASANLWPVLIGQQKGFFTAEGIKLELFYVQSSANLVQQLAVGALDITMSTGLVDPIRAIDQRAPIAIVRFEAQAPPYILVAKPAIKRMADLKGKTISVGGAKDITRIYVERMLAPHGIKPGEFDMIFAGATSARASALLAGAVDAAILLPPFNFHAETAGFTNLGLTIDYAPELPFSGTIVNRKWALANQPLLKRILSAHGQSVAWFYDTANKAEAIRILTAVSSLKPDDVEKAYDFFQKHGFFDRSTSISRTKMTALIDALQSLGDVQQKGNIERFILPEITTVAD